MSVPAFFFTLYGKLTLTLVVLLCLVGVALFVLGRYSSVLYQQEVTQRLNRDLAAHIAKEMPLFEAGAVNRKALQELFQMMMVINPAVEVYLIGDDGRILADAAPYDKVKRQHVNPEPIRRFLERSRDLPLLGDDPRNPLGQKIFSAAPVQMNGQAQGFVYVILGGEEFDSIAALLQGSYIVRLSVAVLIVLLLVGLSFGLVVFAMLTRRLRRLAQRMQTYAKTYQPVAASSTGDTKPFEQAGGQDEIGRLGRSFEFMAKRIDAQVDELRRTDAKRRELIANVSHDLRTPLASMNGYLETLLLKDAQLSAEERQRFVQVAFSHSKDLGRLITELFELARLDSVETLLNTEAFSLAELLQDVAQKFKLAAQERHINLRTELDQNVPFAYGDIGLIQRVLENLIENALRHTPSGGVITLSLLPGGNHIRVNVADTGCGIAAEDLPHIFDRFYRIQKSRQDNQHHAGLGLAIARRIVALHGSTLAASSVVNQGTTFYFDMPVYLP